MTTVPLDKEMLNIMDTEQSNSFDEGAGRNSIVGIPSGGASGPTPSVTGDSVPSGKMPTSSGAPNPNGKGTETPPKGGSDSVPEIKVDPLKHPDDHKHDDTCAAEGAHVVTAEYALEQTARVLMDLAEQQEDPAWVEAHRTLAEQWMAMAQMLLQFRIDAQQNVGEVELKQQQLQQQQELHQQSLTQNDQTHAQGLQQSDQMHKQGLQQKDQQHSMGLDQQTQQHKFKMDSAGKAQKLKLDTQTQQAKQSLAAKKAMPAKSPTSSRPSNTPKGQA